MPDLQAAAARVVDQLRAAGLSASVDPQEVNLPGVLVDAPEVTFRFGKGWSAAWTVTAMAPNVERGEALGILGGLLEIMVDALPWTLLTALKANVQLPDQGAPVPAYQMTFTQRIKD